MRTDLFRKSALERLSSPEQLDQMVRVADPFAWLALIAVWGILLAAVLWSVFGTIPSRISGQGILLREGVFNVASMRGGVVAEMTRLHPGDRIEKGQVIARVAQPASSDATRPARSGIAASAADIVSPYSGRVVEVMARTGDSVAERSPIISLEPDKPLEAIIYFSSQSEAKGIKPGMLAQLSPVTAKREEFGVLLGKVRAVSEFPVTPQGMMAVLNNEALVRMFSRDGPPVAVHVELLPDAASRSGYRWSSEAGAALPVTSGTLCTAAIILREQAPINLWMPMVRHYAGL
ncbi:MAG TPA: NHLP bacteriocin system secretion protein [Paucimonas sp.]|nr:NHLP bacteriocin system secretion protein [Paucimonas sp.]